MDFPPETNPFTFPDSVFSSFRSTQVQCSGRGSQFHDKKESDHRIGKSGKRLLFPYLHSSKKIRNLSARDRSFSFEQNDRYSHVQNGIPKINQSVSSSRGLCNLSGSKRRVFSLFHPSKNAKVSEVRVERESIPVRVSTFRSVDSPIDFHK